MKRPRDILWRACTARARSARFSSSGACGRAALFGLVTAVALATTAPAASADVGPVVTVRPASGVTSSYFRLSARAGSRVLAGDIVVRNPASRPVTVSLDPVAGETASTLGSTYALPGHATPGPTGWLQLDTRRLTLAGGGTGAVSVWVNAPRRAAPGDYLAGVSVEAEGQATETSVRKQLAIASVERYGIGVEVSIPGSRRPRIRFTGAAVEREPGSLAFILYARNRGNVILQDVHGSTTITRAGRRVVSAALGPGTFVTGTSIAYPVPARGQTPPEGTVYHVTAVLYYRGGVARLSTDVRFGHAQALEQQTYGGPKLPHPLPLWLWVVLALAAAALLAAVAYLIRRRRRPLGRNAGLRLLERTIARSAPSREPVSITLIESVPRGRTSRRLMKAIRSRLRPADVMCDMGAGGVLVISPQTRSDAATGLACDLADFLARSPLVDSAPAVGTATARGYVRVLDLIAQARETMGPGVDEISLEALFGDVGSRLGP